MAFLKKNNTKANPASAVNEKAMEQFNGYVSWLDSKGMKNSPELNKGDNALKMMEMYRKENPSFTLTKDDIGAIQQNLLSMKKTATPSVKVAMNPLSPTQTAAVGVKAAEIQGIAKANAPKFSLKKK